MRAKRQPMFLNQAGQAATASPMSKKILDLLSQYFNWDKIRDDSISIYTKTLTEEEMKGMIAFCKSPASQAMLQKQPQLLHRTMGMSQR
jgi:hypothetical protein